MATSTYNTVHEVPEQHMATSTYNTVHMVPEHHVATSTYNTVHEVPEHHVATSTYNTVHQVPEQHVSTSTYKVAHTTQIPHTGYSTSYRTEEVPSKGYLRRLADTAAVSNSDAEKTLTKAGSLKYGEKVVGTYTQKIPYTVQVPHTYAVKVPHTTTYYKTKTNYKYVAKPYTVVTHLVCTPSTHVEYRCPACHGGDSSYSGVADSFGSWLSPEQTGLATHVYHHVYHASSDTPATSSGDVQWSHGANGFYSPAHSNWHTLHMTSSGFASYNADGKTTQSLHQAASVESSTASTSHRGVVIGTSVGVGVAAVAILALVAYKKRNTPSSAEEEGPLSIL